MSHQHASPVCRELLSQISAYIDGELEAELCAQLEKHLTGCQNCQTVVDTIRKTVILYQRCYQPRKDFLPPDVADRLWRAIDEAGCVLKSDGKRAG